MNVSFKHPVKELLFLYLLLLCSITTACNTQAQPVTPSTPASTAIQLWATSEATASASGPSQPDTIIATTRPAFTVTPAAETSTPKTPTATISVTGYLEIDSIPRGAEAWVDATQVGFTPVRHRVKSGSHSVELHLDPFEKWKSTVTVKPGESKMLEVKLLYPIVTTQVITGEVAWLDWAGEDTVFYALGNSMQSSSEWKWGAFDIIALQEVDQRPEAASVSLSRELLSSLEVARSPGDPDQFIGVTHVSPKGQYLFYARLPEGYQHPAQLPVPYFYPVEVWIANIDGSNPHRLGEVLGPEGLIVGWSKDEQFLSLTDPNRLGSAAAYLVRTDGTLYASLEQEPGDVIIPPIFSPDNLHAAYIRNGEELYLLNLETLNTEQVALPLGTLAWSQNGEHLYSFHSHRRRNDEPAGLYRYSLREDTVEAVFTPDQFAGKIYILDAIDLFLISQNERALVVATRAQGGDRPIEKGLWVVKIGLEK